MKEYLRINRSYYEAWVTRNEATPHFGVPRNEATPWFWVTRNGAAPDFWVTRNRATLGFSVTTITRILTNPKSKSKSKGTTGFSLKSQFPNHPVSHPASHPPPEKVSKKQVRARYPKQILLVYVRRLRNMF